ncbi:MULTISPECIES: MarR family winged helix-turn-helix transcriptional regulator [Nonomuraea]|uniref:MarR family winged helix-turn-helix transcriptional regulator n=1 Tax=Nonomuraea mangrovi TaxID=2316207 RepID=A0ABW4SP83_9ACTN
MEDALDTLPDHDGETARVTCRAIRVSRLLERGLKDYFSGHELESWEYDVLATLYQVGGYSCMTDLSNALLLSPGAATNRIDRLVAKDLVTRETAPGNRRMIIVTLTDEGRRQVSALADGRAATERALLSGLSPDEQSAFGELLSKLLLSLDDTEPRIGEHWSM